MLSLDIEVKKCEVLIARNNITIWVCIFILSLITIIALPYAIIKFNLIFFCSFIIGLAAFFIIYSLFNLKILYINYICRAVAISGRSRG